MVELVTKRRKVRYEYIRNFWRKKNARHYGASRYGHDDEYVGDNTWIFRNGYAAQILGFRRGIKGIRIGSWDQDGNLFFTDGPDYVKRIDDGESARKVLDKLSRGELF